MHMYIHVGFYVLFMFSCNHKCTDQIETAIHNAKKNYIFKIACNNINKCRYYV